MRHLPLTAALAAVLALPLLAAPRAAHADCHDRRVTGTVIGGVGGALIGHAIFGGPGGLILGGLGGAAAGHAIAGEGCHRYYYRERSAYYGPAYGYRPPPRLVYDDQYGRAIAPPGTQVASTAPPPALACPTRVETYYDSEGSLRRQTVQDCPR